MATGKTRPTGRPSAGRAPASPAVRAPGGSAEVAGPDDRDARDARDARDEQGDRTDRGDRAFRSEQIVGEVSPAGRVAGAFAVLAALGLAVRPFLPIATRDSHALGRAAGAVGLLGWLPAILLLAGAGAGCLTGRLPRLWLAVVAGAALPAIGVGLRWYWLLDTDRRTVLDLPVGGQVVGGVHYTVGSGLVLGLVVVGVLVLAVCSVGVAWTRTVMEDGGQFERWRPRVGVTGLFVGAVLAGSFCVAGSGSALNIGVPTVTQQEGLQRIGTLVLAAAVVVMCVAGAALRPWLAVAGAWVGTGTFLFGVGVENALAVGRSPALSASAGTICQIVLPLVLLLVAAAVLLSRPPRSEEG